MKFPNPLLAVYVIALSYAVAAFVTLPAAWIAHRMRNPQAINVLRETGWLAVLLFVTATLAVRV